MNVWTQLATDFRQALRRLRDAPWFAGICITTLALGIGGNTAVFTLIDRVMLKPLPVLRPAELYRLGDTDQCCVNTGLPGSFALFSYDLYLHLRDSAPEFSQLAAFQANTRAVTIGRPDSEAPGETLAGSFVSGNYFQMLGLSPAAGRLAQPSDDRPGAAPVAVISHRAWTERFQRRADLIGSTVLLNGVAATLVGVTPEGFYGETLRPDPPELWIPLSNEPQLQPAARLIEAKPSHWLYIIGRLAPGTPTGTLETKLTALLQQWITSTLELSADDGSRIPQQHIKIASAAGGVSNMRDEVAPSLKLLQAVAGAVLLIACANLANLLLARGLSRRTEIAVRVALGAPRKRLAAQFLVESVVLALAGGFAGLLVSFAGARAIIDMTFEGASGIPVEPAPSPLVLGFAFFVSLATGAIFGAAPAIIASRSDPIDAMRAAGRTASERGSWLRRSLVALQVALSLVLIACAGLLARSLDNLQRQDFGFTTEGRYIANLAPSLSTVPTQQLESLYARLQERIERIPGVANAAISLYSPMSGDNWSSSITVDGHGTSERLSASWNRISPRYFATVGTPVLRGRVFDERDRPESPLVAIVSETFARKFFADSDPIGRHIGFTNRTGTGLRNFEIVGVVADAKYQDGRRPAYATFFLPFLQRPPAASSGLDRSHYPQALIVQTASALPNLEAELRRALADVDRRVIIRNFMTLQAQVAGNFNIDRLIARLTVAFGAVALLLACLGLYGVTAYSVSRRTREIGIRMAVGASRQQVLTTVLKSALVQVAIGVAIGVPAVFGAARLLRSTLFGVSEHDPAVLVTALAVLGLSAVIAALIPARRAATMDPVKALRVE
jgi:macrolide transport system ATP-binding/permease protein